MDWDDRIIAPLPKSGLMVFEPWLVMAVRRNPVIRINLHALDEIRLVGDGDEVSAVLLVCGDLEIALDVAEGREAAERIIREASLHTRAAGVTSVEHDELIVVGEDPVLVRDHRLHIGTGSFALDEVRDRAVDGELLRLPGGGVIQAAMALLVVAAIERDRPR